MNMITDIDISRYQQDGYCLLGKIMDDETVAKLVQIARDEPRRDGDKGTYFYNHMRAKHPAVYEFGNHGPQIAAIKKLIGPDIRCWYDQFVVKWGNETKSEFPWHQDNGYVEIDPATNVTVWTALCDVTVDNGCVWVIPGSHQQGLLDHKASKESWHLTLDIKEMGIPVEMKAGEAVAFTGYTLHRSLGNKTAQPRPAMFYQYCHADAVVKNTGHSVNAEPKGLSPVIAGGKSRFD